MSYKPPCGTCHPKRAWLAKFCDFHFPSRRAAAKDLGISAMTLTRLIQGKLPWSNSIIRKILTKTYRGI